MSHVLGSRSLQNLTGVHPNLVKVVKRAIVLSTQDFNVQEGLRSMATQQEYLRRGVTKTLNSKHLKQPDGYSHAVDLVPIINGQPRWEWAAIYPIAEAVRNAAMELSITLTWGGVWDKKLNAISDVKKEVTLYSQRHPGPDFLDGPHYQL